MKIISFVALKGGVGRTTLALLFGQRLAYKGKNVLFFDEDHQCNLTHYYDVYQDSGTVLNIYTNGGDVDILNVAPHIDLIPGSMRLDEAERMLETDSNKNLYLYDWFDLHYQDRNLEQYDYVILDCRPDFGIATRNAIAISNAIISPIIPSEFSFEAKANLELRLSRYRQEEIIRPSRESLITAKLYFLLNKIAHNTKVSKALVAALADDPNIIGQIPQKELFNRSTKEKTMIDMMMDPNLLSQHRSFFSRLSQTLDDMMVALDTL
ncbi:ParA family protein [Streptococcus dentasini]